jgi:hypothetical protein
MSKLILSAIQIITEKITVIIRQMPIYYFYEKTGHVRLRYPKFDECISKGLIYLNAEKEICLKRYSSDIQFIFLKKKRVAVQTGFSGIGFA